jgi:hypothetical protein
MLVCGAGVSRFFSVLEQAEQAENGRMKSERAAIVISA